MKNNNSRGKFVQIGAVIVDKEKDEQGRPKYYIKLSNDTEVIINGQDFTGKYISVKRPTDKFDSMLKKGSITQEEYNEKTARFLKDGDLNYISLELSALIENQ